MPGDEPSDPPVTTADRDATRVWLALLTVYIVWGSTYLAIRIVVADLPPLVTAGSRFLLAGAIVALVLSLRSGVRHLRVERPQLLGAVLVGLALLVGGNGLVMIAEQTVPSGLTALIIASTPFWVILFRVLWREHIPRGTLAGVLVGSVGVAFLVVPSWTGGGADPFGVALLLVAEVCWAVGSFMSARRAMPADPFVSTSIQMLTGGAVMLLIGLLIGEPFEPLAWITTPDAFLAWLYLVFIGSLAGFTAYTWVLQHAPISRVATYAYVNPIVAVVLGVIILGEVVTPAMFIGGAIIVGSVALVIRNESVPTKEPEPTTKAPVAVEEPG